MPSIGDARKFTSKFVTDPFLTLRFHSPVKITLNAGVLFVYDSPGAGIDEYMTSLFDLQFVDGAYVISSFPECSIQP
jgi:hypothetical protein